MLLFSKILTSLALKLCNVLAQLKLKLKRRIWWVYIWGKKDAHWLHQLKWYFTNINIVPNKIIFMLGKQDFFNSHNLFWNFKWIFFFFWSVHGSTVFWIGKIMMWSLKKCLPYQRSPKCLKTPRSRSCAVEKEQKRWTSNRKRSTSIRTNCEEED